VSPADGRPEATAQGESLVIGNEFAEVRVSRINTHNGVRLMIQSLGSGRWISLDPLEAEALTWQNTATISAMVGRPFEPLMTGDET
jgi:hypothetical protein